MTAPVIFGEVLFDRFEDGRKLGGAPFNVAWHLAAFGASPLLVTCVGQDELGEEVLGAMKQRGMRTDGVQVAADRPTGEVTVTLAAGEPHFAIEPDRAYDAIEAAHLPDVDASLLYHGTLALRASTSRDALFALRRRLAAPAVVDVNLRAPWWNRDDVMRWIEGIDTVKLSGAELQQLGFESAEHLRDVARLDRVVITNGARGARCVDGELQLEVTPQQTTEVVDTVGAGDAFTAVLLLGRLREWPVDTTLRRAQQFASVVVSRRGAVVDEPQLYDRLLRDWSTER